MSDQRRKKTSSSYTIKPEYYEELCRIGRENKKKREKLREEYYQSLRCVKPTQDVAQGSRTTQIVQVSEVEASDQEKYQKQPESTQIVAHNKFDNKMEQENVMLDFCELFKFTEFMDYFKTNVYVDVNDFEKNGLKKFILMNDMTKVKKFKELYDLWVPNQKKQVSDDTSIFTQPSTINEFQIDSNKTVTVNANKTDVIDLANRVLRIEKDMNNRFLRIEKILNLDSNQENSKITIMEKNISDIKTIVDKLKKLLIHGESLSLNNGSVIIDSELGWLATKEDLMICGTSSPKTDLSDFLDKIVGRELFENYNSFEQLSQAYQDGLKKIIPIFIKAKTDVGGEAPEDISSITLSRIKKRFQNIKKKQKTTHSSTATIEDDIPPKSPENREN